MWCFFHLSGLSHHSLHTSLSFSLSLSLSLSCRIMRLCEECVKAAVCPASERLSDSQTSPAAMNMNYGCIGKKYI